MQFPKEIIAKSSPRTETGVVSQRVALYEELNGRMIVHREGSPRAFAVIDFVPGGFTTDAAQLAAVEVRHWGGPKRAARHRPNIEVLAGGGIVIGRPPPSELASPSHVLAMWEDGQVWLTERSRSTRKSKAHEPAWKARRYVGRGSYGLPVPMSS
jgi:hypothetical protein